MATGGFKPNAQTDFLEEWKAKREKMRLKMLGDIAAATGASAAGHPGAGTPGGGTPGAGTPVAPLGTSHSNKSTPNMELNNNGNVERGGGSAGNLASAALCQPIARSMSSPALKKPEAAEPHPGPAPPGGNLKKQSHQPDQKAPPPPPPCPPVDSSPSKEVDGVDGDPQESPSPGKGKDKKCAGPSARKGKGQIEKRKLREKRRSTGVVSIPSNEVSPPSPRFVCLFVCLFANFLSVMVGTQGTAIKHPHNYLKHLLT